MTIWCGEHRHPFIEGDKGKTLEMICTFIHETVEVAL